MRSSPLTSTQPSIMRPNSPKTANSRIAVRSIRVTPQTLLVAGSPQTSSSFDKRHHHTSTFMYHESIELRRH